MLYIKHTRYSDFLLTQKLGPEAHGQQFFQRLHHHRLPIVFDHLVGLGVVGADHVDRSVEAAELSDELPADPTGRNRGGGDVAVAEHNRMGIDMEIDGQVIGVKHKR